MKEFNINEFKVNDYITLKLEEGKTKIYIQNKEFMICKRLFLQIPEDSIFEFDDVDSIDEVAEVYKKNLMDGKVYEGIHNEKPDKAKIDISPVEEFWGHCSNIQVWAENDYDTRILHSNIAFQLLEKLSNVGDPKAKKIFKEELVSRISSDYTPTIRYLMLKGFLYYFSNEELIQLFYNEKDELRECMRPFLKILPTDGIEELTILKSLAIIGDPDATRILNAEVESRISSMDIPTMRNLFSQGFLNFFSRNELRQLFYNDKDEMKDFLKPLLKIVQPHERELLKVLKPLVKEGDSLAKKRFSEIFSKRFEDTFFWMFEGGIDGHLLDNFTYDDIHSIFFEEDDNIRQFMKKTLHETEWFNKATAFPILKKLAEMGDPVAKLKLKEEVATKFLKKNVRIVRSLVKEGYLAILGQEDLIPLIFDEKKRINSFLFDLIKSNDFDMNLAFHILEYIKDEDLIVKNTLENEIRKHIEDHHYSFLLNLIKSEFIKYFTKKELLSFFFENDWAFKGFMLQSLQEKDISDSYAIPILQELSRIDSNVENIFKKTILERFKNGSLSDCFFLLKKSYLDKVINEIDVKIKLKPRFKQFKALSDLQKLVPYTISKQDKYGDYGTPYFGYRLDKTAENIEMLSMNSCFLKKIPDVFHNFTSLKELYMYDNQLTNIPNSICKLFSLEMLDLNSNQIEIFPESITKLESLKQLNLSNNRLRKFPNSLKDLKSLIRLELDNNELTDLPMAITDLTSLENLQLQENNLKELPISMQNLLSIKELNLNNNKFENIPDVLFNFPMLSRLTLDNNKLITIPKTIINAKSLRWLTLNNNQLSIFPETLTKLKKLRSLHMNNNQLITLPESIRNMDSLEEIVLRENNFKSFPKVLDELSRKGVRVYTEIPEHMKKKENKQSEEFKEFKKDLLNRMQGTIDMLKELKEKSEREE